MPNPVMLLFVLLLVGIVMAFVEIDAKFRNLIYVVAIVITVIWLAMFVMGMGGGSPMTLFK